uniref:Uncharacterized protein n=1 Tax=Oryza brachyantha TaxID=4533 RepID=J3NCY1_ORYBR
MAATNYKTVAGQAIRRGTVSFDYPLTSGQHSVAANGGSRDREEVHFADAVDELVQPAAVGRRAAPVDVREDSAAKITLLSRPEIYTKFLNNSM